MKRLQSLPNKGAAVVSIAAFKNSKQQQDRSEKQASVVEIARVLLRKAERGEVRSLVFAASFEGSGRDNFMGMAGDDTRYERLGLAAQLHHRLARLIDEE